MKSWLVTGSLLAGLAVILGAFGAHALKSRIEPELLTTFETGVRYHLIHALALVCVGILGFHLPESTLRLPGALFLIGIILFSGSLYGLVFSGIRSFGIITPLGGVAFIAGWGFLAFQIWKAL